MLYELLSGHPPYRFQSRLPEDIARAISTTEPEKPSTVITHIRKAPGDGQDKPALTPERIGEAREGSFDKLRRRLRGDLDRIVLMALRKEPQRRYASVEQFSEDIRLHLSGLPVIARADTLPYRAAKFIRRNRMIVATAALVFLTLVGGIIATTWQARRARAEQARAERRFNDVRKLARSVLFDYHDAIKDLPGATPVRARLVRDALEYLDSLAGEAGDDPSLQRELSTAYERVGDVQGGTMFANLGDTSGAIESYRKAQKIRQALLASDPQNSGTRRDIAFSYMKLGNLLWETGDTAGGLENNRKDLAIAEELSAADPKNEQYRGDIAYAHIRISDMLARLSDFPRALIGYRKSMSLRTEDVRADPANLWKRASLIEANVKISKTLAKSGDRAAALTECDKTIYMMEQTEVEPTNAAIRAFFAEAYADLGEAYSTVASDNSTPTGERQEQWRAACDMYHRSLDILRDMLDRGILSSGDAGKPEMVAREIAKCESLQSK